MRRHLFRASLLALVALSLASCDTATGDTKDAKVGPTDVPVTGQRLTRAQVHAARGGSRSWWLG